MPERPLLLFPHPESVDRPNRSPFPPDTPPPIDTRGQAERIEEQFAQVQAAFVSDEPGDVERVLVMETSSRIDGLQNAVRRVEGLEWLAEVDVDDIELYNLYDEETGKKVKGGRFYILSSNRQATDRLLGLWNQYRANEEFLRGLGIFKRVFPYLLALRRWDVRDRLRDTGILDRWREVYQTKRGTSSEIEFEIELHYRRSEEKRRNAYQEVVQKIESAGGSVGQSICMEDIAFHVLKATLPVSNLDRVMDHDWELGEPESELSPVFHSNSVKYFRPVGQNIDTEGDLKDRLLEIGMNPIDASRPPVLALLDGAPFLMHESLDGRIKFDDPDQYLEAYEPSWQKHGTAMASLICHGDLSRSQAEIGSLTRQIYVRPILKPHPYLNSHTEVIPSEVFQEDVTERAVREIFEGESLSAQNVRVINISLGNTEQHYLHEMSPWARLLDWLSFKYKVLFIVSAGNRREEIRLTLEEGERQPSLFDNKEEVLRDIDKNQRNYRILSPAESMNALTVGALQGDSSGELLSSVRGFDPLNDMDLPSPYSRIGPGYRGSIKPDIFAQGGRLLYDQAPNDDKLLMPVISDAPPGVLVAYPGSRPETLTNFSYQAGTSHAAAISTHYAGHVYEMLEELRSEHPDRLSSDFDAVLIKALLVHSSSQGQNREAYEHLRKPTNQARFPRYVSTYLGFGNTQVERVLECTRTRVTAIGYGRLGDNQRHRYSFPLPVGADIHGHLRLTITLAWFSPINPFHIGMRRAKLFYSGSILTGEEGQHRQESDWQQVRKGTVQHEIFEMKKIKLSGDEMDLFVECVADAGTLDDEIPYGLAVTLEVADQEKINLYELVREGIRSRIRVMSDGEVSN